MFFRKYEASLTWKEIPRCPRAAIVPLISGLSP